MNVKNIVIAVALIGGSLALAIFTEGTLLPIVLPVMAYAVTLLGVKT